MNLSIPVLLYHHVAPDRAITPQAFQDQLQFLLNSGYRSYTPHELWAHVQGIRPLSSPGFVVHFDDGYVDNWVYAYPVLQKLQVSATFFLVADRVERHRQLREPRDVPETQLREREPGGFLSWAEAKAMQATPGIFFGSHTCSHRNFVRREPYRHLDEELERSKREIENQIQSPCEDLAWPWGDYERSWLPRVKKAGYRSAATTLSGANSPGSNPFELRRINVRQPGVGGLAARMRWCSREWSAKTFGLFYGWDRRLKVWWNRESPYSHG